MNYLPAYILASLATLMVLLWSILFFKYRNSFDNIICAIDDKRYMASELFFIGFGLIDLFSIDLNTEKGRRREKKIAEIYGEKYASFHRYCTLGGQITYALTIAPLGFLIGAISNDLFIGLLILAATVAIVAYLDMQIDTLVEKKRDEILADFPEVLSKLTLLVNAGLVIRDAWSKVAYTAERSLYKEMQTTCEQINNGASDIDAFYDFSQRCEIKEIRKFSSILTQNMQKGGSELAASLRYMTDESWEERKHRAKQKGETAGSKLLIPIMIMFLGILIMVIVPIVTNVF